MTATVTTGVRSLTDRVITGNSTAIDAAEGGSRGDDQLATVGTAPPPALGGSEPSPWGVFAGVAAAALTLAVSPLVLSRSFTPKYVVVLLIGGVGLVPFLRSLRKDRSALGSWAALAFLAIGLVSALTSVAPRVSIFGLYLWGTGWLMWVGCAGAYGLGLKLRSRGEYRWVVGGLIVGAIANSLLALYQGLGHPTSSTFGAYNGYQADGFLGNPIYLEALLLGALAVVVIHATRSQRALATSLPILLLMAVALEFTVERLAVILLPVLFIGLVVVKRWRGLIASAAIGLGYLIGYLGAGSGLGSRLSQGTSSPGFGLRLHIWHVAARALVHHPFIGAGPGLFEAATAPLLSQGLARQLGPNRFFSDAHNVLVEVTVTTGVLGLLCFLTWVGSALIRGRNALVLFAVAVLAVELVEPLYIGITPLVFLALGACQFQLATANSPGPVASPEVNEPPLMPMGRLDLSVLVLGALFIGGTMVVGDAALAKAPPNAYVMSEAQRANELLPYWPQSSTAEATMYDFLAATHQAPAEHRRYLSVAVSYLRESVQRAPFDPETYATLGTAEELLGDDSAARQAFEQSLEDDPWAAAAFDGLARLDANERNWRGAIAEYELELSVVASPPDRKGIQANLQQVRHHQVPRSFGPP
jgi:O-antigen ligase